MAIENLKIIESRKFELNVAPDEKTMGQLSGQRLLNLLAEYTNKVPVVLNLAAAPSQDASYKEVIRQHKNRRSRQSNVNWNNVHILHLDDYVDLKRSHPNTFESYLNQHLLDELPIPKDQVHLIKAVQADLQRTEGAINSERLAEEYENIISFTIRKVRSKGGVYIAHIGYGVNGHMAFNEPHIDKWTKRLAIPVQIDKTSIQQQYDDYKNHPNPAARYKSIDDVPRNAITLTMAGILDADYIICVVPGQHKAQAVKGAIDGVLTDSLPASMSRLARDFKLYTTKDSASKLIRAPIPNYES